MTPAECEARVRGRLGLATDDQDSILSYMNEGYAQVLTRTRCAIRSATLDTTPNVAEYQIPDEALAVYEIGGDGVSLIPLAANDVFARQLSVSAYDGVRRMAFIGDMLVLYPTPTEAGEVTFWYTPRPDPVTLVSGTFDLVPAEWHNVIEDYTLWKMADFDDDASSGQGRGYQQDYENGITNLKRAVRHRHGARAPEIRVGTRRRVAHFNDLDVR